MNVREELGIGAGRSSDSFIQQGSQHNNQPSNQQGTRRRFEEEDLADEPPQPKKQKMTGPNWDILESFWPANERPASLQDPNWIERQSIGDLMSLHKMFLKKEQRVTGQAINRTTRDSKPPMVVVEGSKAEIERNHSA